MNSQLRKHVQIKKSNKWYYLNEIDLKCAQPLLLSFLIEDAELFDIVSDDIYEYLINKQPDLLITSDWNKKTNSNEAKLINYKLSRKDMKEYFYKFLFDTKVKQSGVVYQLLEANLPHILNKIIEVKHDKKNTGLNLAQRLQQKEADIMNAVYWAEDSTTMAGPEVQTGPSQRQSDATAAAHE